MDSGRLPAYRSSYLLRFHPYPRVKPSTRERITASAQDEDHYEPLQLNVLDPEKSTSFILNEAIHETDAHAEMLLRQRRLSMSSLVVDLAFLIAKRMHLQDK